MPFKKLVYAFFAQILKLKFGQNYSLEQAFCCNIFILNIWDNEKHNENQPSNLADTDEN
jgi:hypothetical protein